MGMTKEESSSVKSVVETMESFFSQKYGLASITTFSEWGGVSVSIGGHRYVLGNEIPMFTTSVKSRISDENSGAGVSFNQEVSKAKAYGEFIERYCGKCDNNEFALELLFDSADNLIKKGINCLDYGDLLPFLDCQYDRPDFPFPKYFTKHPISWVKGKNLVLNEDVYLPAKKVYLRFPCRDGELSYVYSLSTGLACGTGYSSTALNAICEVIERDSFMLSWQLSLSGELIIPDEFRNDKTEELYAHINKYLFGEDELFLYDISRTEGVYTILSFVRNNLPNSFGLIVATASHPDPEIAVLKSLEELCQSYNAAHIGLLRDNKERKCYELKPSEVNTLDKHFLYYSSSRNNRNIDFVAEDNKTVLLSEMTNYSAGTGEADLEYLMDLFKKAETSIYVADITREEIRESGLRVLRAIIPGYVDLEPDHNLRHLKSARLQSFQEKYGVAITDNPHPFP